MKEHQRDIRLKHITQSTLSKHNIETPHTVWKQLQYPLLHRSF